VELSGWLIIIILIILTILISIIFWFVFTKPILNNISNKIEDKVFPDLIHNTKVIITLSTAAIIFTVKEYINIPYISKMFLIISWIAFLICIIFSIFLLFILFLYKANNGALWGQLDRLSNELDKMEKDIPTKDNISEDAHKLLKKTQTLCKTLFLLHYLQNIFLFIALALLILFGINNINI